MPRTTRATAKDGANTGIPARWSGALTETLSPLLPYDLVAETIDALTTTIVHAGVELESRDGDLSLASLESHALTLLLQEQLSPVVEDAIDGSGISWSFLASQVIECYLAGPPLEDEALGSSTLIQGHHSGVERDDGADSEMEVLGKHECELCERVMPLTIHHLVPRSTHAYFLAHPHLLLDGSAVAADDEGSGKRVESIDVSRAGLLAYQARVCRPCHTQIHKLIPDHKELGRAYNSIDRLCLREDVRRWIGYVRKQRGSDARMGRGLRYRR